jgi:hypothetical protein
MMKVVPMISVCALAACTALAGNAFAEGGRSHPKMAAATPLARAALFPNGVLGKGGDPGDDDTAISLAPNLSALCQSYIGKLNTYANPRPNVDQIVDDQFVLAGTQLGCDTAQNETTITVNPSNPRNLVAGTNDYRATKSEIIDFLARAFPHNKCVVEAAGTYSIPPIRDPDSRA